MNTRSHGVGTADRRSARDAGLARRMLAVSLLGLGLGMTCRPALASNDNVLIIYDEYSQHTQSLAAALESAGLHVTFSDTSETEYTGANPGPTGFAAVIHLNGTTFGVDMPLAGQQALVSYVQGGGGYLHSEWDTFEYFDEMARMQAMRNLILFDSAGGADSDTLGVPLTYNVVPGREGHPVLANVPSSFSFAAGWNLGPVHPFSSDPATVLMRDQMQDAAVAVREFGSGRIVGFNHAGNYMGFPVLSDLRIQQLYVNAARWAGRIQENRPPVANPGSYGTIEATGTTTPVALDGGASYDPDGDTIAEYRWSEGSTPLGTGLTLGVNLSLGTHHITLTVLDPAGLSGSASVDVTVVDTTPPVITGTEDVTVEATGPGGAAATFSASATDRVDGPVAVAYSTASGSTFPLGATTITATATDAHGNSASQSFQVSVVDTTAPTFSGTPADVTVEAAGPEGATVAFNAPQATDGAGPVTVTCSPASGSVFPLGATTVTCTATDASGNTATTSFTVHVADTTAPAISLPGDLTLEATSASGAAASFAVSATDRVDGSVPVSCSPTSGATFPLGTTTVTCTATDAAGNTASATFHVNVVDSVPPVLTLPGDITATATSAAGAVVTFAASAADAVSGPVSVSCSPVSGTTFPLGTTTVTCTATDAAGNTATGSFRVTVAYAWSGFLAPIRPDGSSIFRQGRTVPVKFRLTGASAGVHNATALLYVTHVCQSTAGDVNTDDCTDEETDGCVFRYDPCSGQYIYNLRTRHLEPGTYQLRIDLGDGVTRTVDIGLR